MKIYQENKEKIEDYLFIITVLIFVISTIANAPYMFSPAGEATLWGATCSYSYLAIWLVATYVLRKRKGWIWSTFIVRLMTIVSFCLTMLLTKFNLDIKNMLRAIIAYIPYGLLVPVWDRQLLVPCYLFECNYKERHDGRCVLLSVWLIMFQVKPASLSNINRRHDRIFATNLELSVVI